MEVYVQTGAEEVVVDMEDVLTNTILVRKVAAATGLKEGDFLLVHCGTGEDAEVEELEHGDRLRVEVTEQQMARIRRGQIQCASDMLTKGGKAVDEDTLRSLVAAGLPLEAPLRTNDTPLIAAARLGLPSVCKILLDAGASTTATTLFGMTPITAALASGSAELCMMLKRRLNIPCLTLHFFKEARPLEMKDTSPLAATAWLVDTLSEERAQADAEEYRKATAEGGWVSVEHQQQSRCNGDGEVAPPSQHGEGVEEGVCPETLPLEMVEACLLHPYLRGDLIGRVVGYLRERKGCGVAYLRYFLDERVVCYKKSQHGMLVELVGAVQPHRCDVDLLTNCAHREAYLGRYSSVEALINFGANPAAKDHRGVTLKEKCDSYHAGLQRALDSALQGALDIAEVPPSWHRCPNNPRRLVKAVVPSPPVYRDPRPPRPLKPQKVGRKGKPTRCAGKFADL